MTQRMKLRKKTIIVAMFVFVLIFSLLFSIFMILENKSYYQKREQYLYMAANQTSIIEGCLDTVIARAYTLSALVVENNGDTSFFEKAAASIYDGVYSDTGVKLKNIAIAPGGIVEKVYPETGNQGLLGFDFMDTTKSGNKEAVQAYNEGKLIITNPFSLSQGGNGMAGRLPVFLNDSDEIWGLVTITIDYDLLMEKINIEKLDEMKVRYKLWYTDESGETVILRESSKKVENSVSYDVNPKNLIWHLELSPADGWHDKLEMTLGIILITLVSLFFVYILISKVKIQRINEQLKILAHCDGLTGCFSRHYLNSVVLSPEDGNWRDSNMKYSMVIVDMDHFKQINDTYGHRVGDEAIVAIANMLQGKSKIEDGDAVIRFGGDEFIVLYNDLIMETLERKAREIVEAAHHVIVDNNPDIKLTLSVGGALYGEDTTKYNELFKKADANLYKAKESGKDKYFI